MSGHQPAAPLRHVIDETGDYACRDTVCQDRVVEYPRAARAHWGAVALEGVNTVARVEWTRQQGDDVEAVVGMLICSVQPNAVRVTPSQGDGGLDIFVPGPEGMANQREVYQVKRYCERLSSSQTRKIKRSLETLIGTAKAEGWEITKWHLVMPLDPTDNEIRWFNELTQNCEFPREINGLLFGDTLAARFPKVIDYYLRDGRERLEGAMNNLAAIIAGRANRQQNEPLGAGDVVSDLASIHKALNEYDPFYHYDFAVSEKPPADQPTPGEPGLVAVYGVRQESAWITIMIFALSLAAVEERPIGGQFTVVFPPEDDELRKQFEKFIDYGAPMTMPPGTLTGFPGSSGRVGRRYNGRQSASARRSAKPGRIRPTRVGTRDRRPRLRGRRRQHDDTANRAIRRTNWRS